ncbi:MAG: DUF362 domain-containing protein [Propionibacteriaceae bacterium]|nr:DUF362 domain-containing protein [Propionibacteriaceae bacterium]
MPNAKVYFTKDVSSAGLLAAYQALGKELPGKVLVKLHMGEEGNTNYLDPELLRDLTAEVNGTFGDANTGYGGARSTAEGHRRVAAEHGFTYAPVDILDEDGDIEVPANGKRIKRAIISSHVKDYDSFVSVAHFKGHAMAGFGGTLKNLAVGVASSRGKLDLHGSRFNYHGEEFLERLAEYSKAIIDSMGENIVYLNVLCNLSTSCDCDSNAPDSELADIGIVSSLDPIAIDQASVDLLVKYGGEKSALLDVIDSHKGTYTLGYGEQIGLGTRAYDLVEL